MKYICLGYIEDKYFTGLSLNEQQTFMDNCFAYDEELRKNGHFAGGEGLQGPQTAATLRLPIAPMWLKSSPPARASVKPTPKSA